MRKQLGYSLVELMVAVTIVGVLAAIAIPEIRIMVENGKISTAAHSVMNGLQLARAEAIKRNLPIEFDLTAGAVDAGSVASIVPAANGQNWMVRVQDPVNGISFVQGRAADESALQSVQIAGVAAVTFNGLGENTMAAQAQYGISNPKGGACAPGGPMRCLRVQVSPGGQARICDPLAAVGDNRRC